MVTLSFTTFYLIFYSVSKEIQMELESINYMGLLVFIYFVAFAFLGGELFNMPQFFYWLFLTVILCGANLVMV